MNCTDRRFWCLGLALAAAAAVAGCVGNGGEKKSGPAPAVWVDVLELPLAGPITDPAAEISGMTWMGDTLVALPQYPDKFAGAEMMGTFAFRRTQIMAMIDSLRAGLQPAPLLPRQKACMAPGLRNIVQGFDGLEAIGLIGTTFYMTMEAEPDTAMAGYLISGHFDLVEDNVVIDMTRLTTIPMGLDIPNIAEETLVIAGDRVITISEANGRNVNPEPKAKVFGLDLAFLGSIPFPNIEYRVTDGTSLDEQGRFWVINYYFPPEGRKIDPAPEIGPDGETVPFDPDACIERLLELQLISDGDGERIVRTDTPPVNLNLLPDGECRNWEALARLEGLGFLLMTDKYPTTMMAFVPYEEKR